MERIFLIGPPGAGKTAVGQALAEATGCDFFDTDKLIEAEENCSIRTIFQKHGEIHFRALETVLLNKLEKLRPKPAPLVIFATGGGLPAFNDNIKRLHALGTVIALTADMPVLVARLCGGGERPLLDSTKQQESAGELHDKLQELLRQRFPFYRQAKYRIDTSKLCPIEIAKEIIDLLDIKEQ